MDQKPLEDALKDLSIEVKPEGIHQQALENDQHKEVVSTIIRSRKVVLILDLNGLLIDHVTSNIVPHGYNPDVRMGPRSIFKRPFCDDFLKFCFERFDVGIWTSRTKRNMDSVIEFLMPPNMRKKLLFCWDQSHCTITGFNTIENSQKPLMLKELKKLWKKLGDYYNESNTLLIDDSPYKALLNPPNTAIFPYSYGFEDVNDNALGLEGDIRVYLEGLAAANGDVPKYVEQHLFGGQCAITNMSPSWGFYSRVLSHVLKSNVGK